MFKIDSFFYIVRELSAQLRERREKGILADDSEIFSAVASAVNPTDAESGNVESVDKGVYKYRPEGHANLKKRRRGYELAKAPSD